MVSTALLESATIYESLQLRYRRSTVNGCVGHMTSVEYSSEVSVGSTLCSTARHPLKRRRSWECESRKFHGVITFHIRCRRSCHA